MTNADDRARAEAERRFPAEVAMYTTGARQFVEGARWQREQEPTDLSDALKMIDALSAELVEVGQRSPSALMQLQLDAVTSERDQLKAEREQDPTCCPHESERHGPESGCIECRCARGQDPTDAEVEAAAIAIRLSRRIASRVSWDRLTDTEQEAWLDCARAALLAARYARIMS